MSLTVKSLRLPSADIGNESTLPSLYEMANVQGLTRADLDEDDELFVGYGFLPSIFPYRMQDLYDRGTGLRSYEAFVLENDYLKAIFIPALGGRLWSLYDKQKGRDLLYTNSIVRPCNLAVRNAWLAGGIEFNCGMVGHHPFTCSPLNAVVAELEDGTPVLRMFEYERIRGCVYQMDFFLPDDSRFLYGRMRIVNPTPRTTPMYWWTNMAVRENPKARNIIDATETYNNRGGRVGKNPVPLHEGIDITYPSNNPVAIDYFWKIPAAARKYTAYLDEEGYGFIQASTARLKGRKLFVWGQGEGGARWQEFLTKDGEDGRYVEIQAGLAHTQYECIPMPPNTAWEWLEAYGAMQADPALVHGDWADARREVGERLEAALPAAQLEHLLAATKKMAVTKGKGYSTVGSAFGRLENLRREKMGEPPLCPHLSFPPLDEHQAPWYTLLCDGKIPSDHGRPPLSWMLQPEWTRLIEESVDNHEKYLHLAAIYMAEHRLVEADLALLTAESLGDSPIARFLRAQVLRLKGDTATAAREALAAHRTLPGDLSLARQAYTLALSAGLYDQLMDAYAAAPATIHADGRATMLYAFARLRTGDPHGAEELLHRGGGLQVTDIREGEVSLTSLYIEIRRTLSEKAGTPFDPADVDVPRKFDFRMKVPKRKNN